MRFENEADLLSQLQPHRDGLLIEDAGRQAVFLPAVWEQLAGKEEFLAHLRAKAGLPRGHWSPHFCASRFITTQTIEEPVASRGLRAPVQAREGDDPALAA